MREISMQYFLVYKKTVYKKEKLFESNVKVFSQSAKKEKKVL